MGNPAYDARRAAEKAEYEKDQAAAEAAKAALEGLTAFFTGQASLFIEPCNHGTSVRFVLDRQNDPSKQAQK